MGEDDALLPRRRTADRLSLRSDHDLLRDIASDVRAIVNEQRDQAARIRSLEEWRREHMPEAAVRDQAIRALVRGDDSHNVDIDALELWRAEMRGSWATIKAALAAIGALSGLSLLLELARLAGMLH